MICPICQGESTVVDVRYVSEKNTVRRRRMCKECGERWTTYEIDIIDFDFLDELRDTTLKVVQKYEEIMSKMA